MTFFFYGTLTDPDVLASVVGRSVPAADRRRACLDGYRRVARDGASYPILVPDPAARVDGVLVSGLDARDRIRLQRFEGPDYWVDRLSVQGPGGRAVTACVFMPQPWVRGSAEPWDLATWRRRHKRRYIARLRAFGMCDPD